MDGISEVNRGGSSWQCHNVALGRKYVDFRRANLKTKRIKELTGISGFALPIQDLAQPSHLCRGLLSRGLLLALVLPVRGNAVFSPAVHLVGADLDLNRFALRTNHGGVQRLIHVELRHRDVVFETARNRSPAGVN